MLLPPGPLLKTSDQRPVVSAVRRRFISPVKGESGDPSTKELSPALRRDAYGLNFT